MEKPEILNHQLPTPEDVKKVKFDVRHVRGGYDIDQVDEFLDRLYESYNATANNNVQVVLVRKARPVRRSPQSRMRRGGR